MGGVRFINLRIISSFQPINTLIKLGIYNAMKMMVHTKWKWNALHRYYHSLISRTKNKINWKAKLGFDISMIINW